MKQSMAIDEGINEYSEWSCTCGNLNMHAENDPSGCGCVPGPPVTNALSWNRISGWRIDKIMRMPRNKINQTNMVNKSINQSVTHKITYVSGPPKPDLFLHELVSQIPLS